MNHPALWLLEVSGSRVNAGNLQIIFLKVRPQKIMVEFLICAGAQVLVNTKKTANILKIMIPSCHKIKFTSIDGMFHSKSLSLASGRNTVN